MGRPKKIPEEEIIINEEEMIIDPEEAVEETPVAEAPAELAEGDTVSVQYVYRHPDADRKIRPLIGTGVIQRINKSQKHPYLLGGLGWTDAEWMEKL